VKVFFDTNILLNSLLGEPGAKSSNESVLLCREGDHEGWIAWHTISNAHYIARSRSKSPLVALDFVADLLAWVEIAETGKHDALAALEFGMRDFEDALQLTAAVACGSEVILTRNTTDFKVSPIPVMTPEEFLASLAQ
jgi:predicted nucleic acid-binding protein